MANSIRPLKNKTIYTDENHINTDSSVLRLLYE